MEFSWGYMGVTLFFVLSAFLSIANMKEELSPKRWWGNRIIRLFPIYWVSMSITFGVTKFLLPDRSVSFSVFIINLTMLNDLFGIDVYKRQFVFPSVFEGLGIVNIEAQTSGVLTICSDAVPVEANISPVFTSIPLEKSAAEWAEIIVKKYDMREPRKDMSKYVIDARYDTKDLANRLQGFYLEQYSKIREN